jgi:hypothetical protein
MRFVARLAGLFLFASVAMFAAAQRGIQTSGRAGGTTLAVPAAGSPAQHSPSAARPSYLPAPIGGVRAQAGPIVFAHPPLTLPRVAASRFALQNAPASVWSSASLKNRAAIPPNTFLGRGFRGGTEPRRPFPNFPQFFFGGGPSACSPLLPGYFGSPWFDRQFTCFGTPFYGVNAYPQGFLAPQLAYEPWLEGWSAASEQSMYGVGDLALAAGNLDMIAGIAARESGESNPNLPQVTTLVLKDGIFVGVTDYWVDGDKLGYITTYERQNTIDLDRLDLQKTVNLNSARGIPFVLQERAAPPAPVAPAR